MVRRNPNLKRLATFCGRTIGNCELNHRLLCSVGAVCMALRECLTRSEGVIAGIGTECRWLEICSGAG